MVLPGLDTDLDDDAWQSIGGVRDARWHDSRTPPASEPSAICDARAARSRFGIKRGDVEILGKPAHGGREVLVSEAMRPSNATAQWHDRLKRAGDRGADFAAGMNNLAVVEAANPEMEALAIAVAMREARHLDKSAALVTPDRALARRVTAALGRWNLEFDDSGGDALMETPAGIFARLAAEAATKGLEPPTLLALLKHPLCRLGGAHGALKRGIEVLELALLRGTRPQAGSGGLAADFARFREELRKLRNGETSSLHHAEPRARLKDHELDRAQALIAALRKALAPLESLPGSRSRMISPNWHSATARRWAIFPPMSTASPWHSKGRTGSALASAFDDLLGRQREDRPDGRGRRLSGSIPGRLCRPHGAAAGAAGRAAPHLRPTGSAADGIRPRHPGRARRNRVAAGAARRSLAEPADAP